MIAPTLDERRGQMKTSAESRTLFLPFDESTQLRLTTGDNKRNLQSMPKHTPPETPLKTVPVFFRCTAEEAQAMNQSVQDHGMSRADWLRAALRACAGLPSPLTYLPPEITRLLAKIDAGEFDTDVLLAKEKT